MQFFNIETCHQTMVSLDATSEAFVHVPNSNTKSPAQLITTAQGIGILLGRTSVEVQSGGCLIPFRVRSEAHPMLYTLIDPVTAIPTESQNHRANRQFLLGATRVCFVINWDSTVRGGWGGS